MEKVLNNNMITKCILGSQSPRRQELMTLMGIPFEVRVSDVEENFPENMDVRTVAEFLAIKSKFPNTFITGTRNINHSRQYGHLQQCHLQ